MQSSLDGIYAAGDVCSYESRVHGRRLRVEHWDVAMQQGQHAAQAMMGDAQPYEVVPYFFSDLVDWASLEYVGPATDWDEEIWRGDRTLASSRSLPEGRQGGRRLKRGARGSGAARTLLAEGVDVGAEEAKALLGTPTATWLR